MAKTATTKRGDSDEKAATILAQVALDMYDRSVLLKEKADEEIVALEEITARAMEEINNLKALAPSPLTRTKTIRPNRPPNAPFVPVKPSDYLTPRYKGRAKKKAKLEPPPAPRIRPVPRDLSKVEVIDLTASDARIVTDLTGETPGRVTKTADDVFVEFEGIKLSMNALFEHTCEVVDIQSLALGGTP